MEIMRELTVTADLVVNKPADDEAENEEKETKEDSE